VVVCDAADGMVLRYWSAFHPDATEVDPQVRRSALDRATAGGLPGSARQRGGVAMVLTRPMGATCLLEVRSCPAGALMEAVTSTLVDDLLWDSKRRAHLVADRRRSCNRSSSPL
jgi:hypothetical protein